MRKVKRIALTALIAVFMTSLATGTGAGPVIHATGGDNGYIELPESPYKWPGHQTVFVYVEGATNPPSYLVSQGEQAYDFDSDGNPIVVDVHTGKFRTLGQRVGYDRQVSVDEEGLKVKYTKNTPGDWESPLETVRSVRQDGWREGKLMLGIEGLKGWESMAEFEGVIGYTFDDEGNPVIRMTTEQKVDANGDIEGHYKFVNIPNYKREVSEEDDTLYIWYRKSQDQPPAAESSNGTQSSNSPRSINGIELGVWHKGYVGFRVDNGDGHPLQFGDAKYDAYLIDQDLRLFVRWADDGKVEEIREEPGYTRRFEKDGSTLQVWSIKQ